MKHKTQKCPRCNLYKLYKSNVHDFSTSKITEQRICVDCGVDEVIDTKLTNMRSYIERHQKNLKQGNPAS